jgi:hypothetical protein
VDLRTDDGEPIVRPALRGRIIIVIPAKAVAYPRGKFIENFECYRFYCRLTFTLFVGDIRGVIAKRLSDF